MKKKRNIILVVVLLILVLIFGGLCLVVNNKDTKDDLKQQEPNVEKNDTQPEEKKVQIIDTGSNERPYAVMINTHNAALPQSGLQNAYIVYELMVEGGITRMMALYKGKDVDRIGSVRSARMQYLGYVYENDAIYMHAGGAKDALNKISNEGINHIDVDGQYGFRDTGLNRAWEHTLFTSTNLIKQGISNMGFRTTTDSGNLLTYQVDSLNLDEYQNKTIANNISIKYSYYRTSQYNYDSNSKTYLRSMNDNPNNDLVTGEQYKVKNIIVYGLDYTEYQQGSNTKYQKINNIGTGEGYYITEGYAIPIIWSKDSEKSQTKYKVKETGKDLIVNDGNTYIQIYPTSGNLTIN